MELIIALILILFTLSFILPPPRSDSELDQEFAHIPDSHNTEKELLKTGEKSYALSRIVAVILILVIVLIGSGPIAGTLLVLFAALTAAPFVLLIIAILITIFKVVFK